MMMVKVWKSALLGFRHPQHQQKNGSTRLCSACGMCRVRNQFSSIVLMDRNINLFPIRKTIGSSSPRIGYARITASWCLELNPVDDDQQQQNDSLLFVLSSAISATCCKNHYSISPIYECEFPFSNVFFSFQPGTSSFTTLITRI